MPEVVSQVEALEAAAARRGSSNGAGASGNGAPPKPRLKTWAAAPGLFPCDVSPEGKKAVQEVRPLNP